MEKKEIQNNNYYFSIKGLIISVIFLILNLMLFAWLFLGNSMSPNLLPKIYFADQHEVHLSSDFEKEFKPNSGQEVLMGTTIKTGADSFAELKWGQTNIRLAEDTVVNLSKNKESQEVILLKQGKIWVLDGDHFIVKSDRSKVQFNRGLGLYEYRDLKSNLFIWQGYAELSLMDSNGKFLTQFIVPPMHKVSFVDSQIIPTYSALKNSKLKKELKLSRLNLDQLGDDFIEKIRLEKTTFAQSINSKSQYEFKKFILNLFSKIQLKSDLDQKLSKLNLNYLLGYLNSSNLRGEAEQILEKSLNLTADDLSQKIAEIQRVQQVSVAYKVKKAVINQLVEMDQDPIWLREKLVDLDYVLGVEAMQQAESIANDWLGYWSPANKIKYAKEWLIQRHLYHYTMLAHANKVNLNLINLLSGISSSLNSENTLDLAQEKLEVARALVLHGRYAEAKSYLKTSYDELDLEGNTTYYAARDLFIKEGLLLGERIAFAEKSLKGSASKMDEKAFLDYLSVQDRDEGIAKRFEDVSPFKGVDQEVKIEFSKQEIVDQLLDYGVRVDPANIQAIDQSVSFKINEAFLSDGVNNIAFKADYNPAQLAIYNLKTDNKQWKGSFSLTDLGKILSPSINSSKEFEATDLSEILIEGEGIDRSTLVAQDLAIQLAINELEKNNIFLTSPQQIEIIDQKTLQKFNVREVFLSNANGERVQVDFTYDSTDQMISHLVIKNTEKNIDMPSQVEADKLVDLLFNKLSAEEVRKKKELEVIEAMSHLGLSLRMGDFMASNSDEIRFNRITIKELPIEFSGIYKISNASFLKADHELLNEKNIKPYDYIKKLSEKWLIKHLSENGLIIKPENIATELPAERILIQNYEKEDKKISFIFDVVNQRLLSIAIQGEGGLIDEMSFDEFELLR